MRKITKRLEELCEPKHNCKAFEHLESQLSALQSQLSNMTEAYIKANEQLNNAGDVIGYPDEWDTACYDTLQSALDHREQCNEADTQILEEKVAALQKRNDELGNKILLRGEWTNLALDNLERLATSEQTFTKNSNFLHLAIKNLMQSQLVDIPAINKERDSE